MIQTYYIYCALYYCCAQYYYYISSNPGDQALDPGIWRPLPWRVYENEKFLDPWKGQQLCRGSPGCLFLALAH